MELRDRFTMGLMAGLAAGIIMNALDYLTYYLLNITDVRYLDWAAVLIYGNKPTTLVQTVFAQAGQLFFTSLVGVVFALLVPWLRSRNLLLKGWFYSLFIWFSTYSLAIALRLPGLTDFSLGTAISHFVSASIYGLVLAEVLRRLHKTVKL